MYICGYKHDWAPAASNKDTVAMGFVRGTAMVDFHKHGRLEKMVWARLGLAVSVPDNETVKNSGLARLGSDRVGHREGGEFGRFSRGAWEINRAAFKLAWLGLAWLGFSGGGGLGGRVRLHLIKWPVAMRNFCGILFVSVERWYCVYMGASAATNTTGHPLRQIKIPWQWVSCAEQRWWTFTNMVALKKWFGLG